MNSEEDTFNRLRRIPYEEMRNIYMSDNNAFIYHIDTEEHKKKPAIIEYTKKLFEKYGWTVEEYEIEIKTYWNKYENPSL